MIFFVVDTRRRRLKLGISSLGLIVVGLLVFVLA